MPFFFSSNSVNFDENEFIAGGSDYGSDSINSLDINWSGGKILIVESDEKKLYFKENVHGEKITDEQKIHWCINGKKLFITYTKPGVTITNSLVKNLSLCVPKKLKYASFNVVNSSINYKKITVEKIDTNNVNSNLELEFLDCKKLNVSGVNSEINFVLHENLGAKINLSGISGGFLGDREEKYGKGKLKVNISGVNIKYKVVIEKI